MLLSPRNIAGSSRFGRGNKVKRLSRICTGSARFLRILPRGHAECGAAGKMPRGSGGLSCVGSYLPAHAGSCA